MKQWPENDEPFASYHDLAQEIVDAVRFAYALERQNRGKNILLEGPDAPATASELSGIEFLSTAAYSDEEKGLDALTKIAIVAIRIGMEQGRRIHVTKVLDRAETLERNLGYLRRECDSGGSPAEILAFVRKELDHNKRDAQLLLQLVTGKLYF